MTRREFSNRTRFQAWERARGKCEECGVKLNVGDRREFDHRIPCGLGGDNSLENCVVLCAACHRDKTDTEDIPRIAKAKRVAAKHTGAFRPKSTIPGSKGSKWKRKMDGTVVRRD
ncbi:HNH nuclease [Roseobacter sp. AzwK-3b]|uniref:HNH endonuclease n=1 Tax=Roseobacter sp. AzwK-3b TaxID=351016 RepID=UPI000156A4D5|nr:HNH endonuclease signature motif containing protein [Roseobacter sp. AzwK-3b]EDM70802.1 HNH nuclease [Roseobacter sp. AzwK-3b]